MTGWGGGGNHFLCTSEKEVASFKMLSRKHRLSGATSPLEVALIPTAICVAEADASTEYRASVSREIILMGVELRPAANLK